jgi:hypothetical protein
MHFRLPASQSILPKYWISTFYWGLLDFAIALFLLTGLATAIGASLEFFDHIRRDNSGFYAPDQLIGVMISNPLGQGFWLTAMLVTTLVPTLLHFIAVGLGLLNTLLRPVYHGTRLSSILMYGPAHPLFDFASHQVARLQLMRVIRTTTLAFAWVGLLGCLLVFMLGSGWVLQSLGNSLRVGQQFAAIMIDML